MRADHSFRPAVRTGGIARRRYDPRVQSLPTEAGPLAHCSQCGKRVPPPSGKPTFVYGVGAVGHQSCDACGAKWRYLWKEPESIARRSRRPIAIIGAVLLVAVVAVVSVEAFRGSSKKFAATTTTTSSTLAPVTSVPAGSDGGATGADFVRVFGPANAAKTEFMQWLVSTAPATPEFDVNQHVNDFVRSGRDSQSELMKLHWPQPVADDVAKLAQAYGTFLDDANRLQYGLLYSPSFSDQLRSESQAVKDAATLVRHELGLPPA